jgi:hypothetical protein
MGDMQSRISAFLTRVSDLLDSERFRSRVRSLDRSLLDWKDKNRVVFVLAAIATFCLFFLLVVPKCYLANTEFLQPRERIELEDKLRGTWATILTGGILLVGLYFTWRRIAATERNVEIAKEAQTTERFTRAIDQLGASHQDGREKVEIRLGGIYALERIARDSEKDHGPIMEILTAYVRENARWKWKPEDERPDENDESGDVKPQEDIQAILTVLQRRATNHEKEKDLRFDLSHTDMRGARMAGISLRKAYLKETHLEDALLSDAHLDGAHLVEAHLEGAWLPDSHLTKANLIDAHLWRVNLCRAHLEEANLFRAYLKEALLMDAHLERADLRGACLKWANLEGAYLQVARSLSEYSLVFR